MSQEDKLKHQKVKKLMLFMGTVCSHLFVTGLGEKVMLRALEKAATHTLQACTKARASNETLFTEQGRRFAKVPHRK